MLFKCLLVLLNAWLYSQAQHKVEQNKGEAQNNIVRNNNLLYNTYLPPIIPQTINQSDYMLSNSIDGSDLPQMKCDKTKHDAIAIASQILMQLNIEIKDSIQNIIQNFAKQVIDLQGEALNDFVSQLVFVVDMNKSIKESDIMFQQEDDQKNQKKEQRENQIIFQWIQKLVIIVLNMFQLLFAFYFFKKYFLSDQSSSLKPMIRFDSTQKDIETAFENIGNLFEISDQIWQSAIYIYQIDQLQKAKIQALKKQFDQIAQEPEFSSLLIQQQFQFIYQYNKAMEIQQQKFIKSQQYQKDLQLNQQIKKIEIIDKTEFLYWDPKQKDILKEKEQIIQQFKKQKKKKHVSSGMTQLDVLQKKELGNFVQNNQDFIDCVIFVIDQLQGEIGQLD